MAISQTLQPQNSPVELQSVLSRLSFTGASSVLCEALVAAVGLDKDRDPTSLGPGSSQAKVAGKTFFDRFS